MPEVAESSVIQAFKAGLRNRWFTEDVAINPPRTTSNFSTWQTSMQLLVKRSNGMKLLIKKTKKIPLSGPEKQEKKSKKSLKNKKNRKPDNEEVLAIPEKFTKGKKDFTGRNKAKAPTSDFKKSKKWCPLHQAARHDLHTYWA